MNRHYRKGRDFEWQVARDLRRLGWYVVRVAKSGFPDLVAFKKGRVFGVECKYNQRLAPRLTSTLEEWTKNSGVSALLVCRYPETPFLWVSRNAWIGKKLEPTLIVGKRE